MSGGHSDYFSSLQAQFRGVSTDQLIAERDALDDQIYPLRERRDLLQAEIRRRSDSRFQAYSYSSRFPGRGQPPAQRFVRTPLRGPSSRPGYSASQRAPTNSVYIPDSLAGIPEDFTGFENEYSQNYFEGQSARLFQGGFTDVGQESTGAFVDRLSRYVGDIHLRVNQVATSIVTYETQRREAEEALAANPGDPDAQADLNEAREMLEKLLFAFTLTPDREFTERAGNFGFTSCLNREGLVSYLERSGARTFSERVSAVKRIAAARVRQVLSVPSWTTPT